MIQHNSLTLKNPFYGITIDTALLGLYFFLLPLDFIGGDFGSVTKLVAMLPVGYTLFFCFLRNMKINIYLLVIFVVYYVINYASILRAPAALWVEERASTLILNYIMIIICSSLKKSSKEIDFLKKSIAYSVVWVLLFIMSSSIVTINGRMILSTGNNIQDPNYLCGYLIFPMLFFINNILLKEKKFTSFLAIFFMIYVIFQTGSRGGLIALFIAVFVYILAAKINKMSNKIIVLSTIIFLICLSVMLFVPDEIMQRYNLSYTLNDGGAGRFDIWKDLFGKYQKFDGWQKLFGFGAANVRLVSSYHKVAHNLWLETLVELGVLGLIGLIWIHSYFIIRAWKTNDKIYFATIIGYEIMTLSMSLYTYKPMFTVFLMINIIRLKQIDERTHLCDFDTVKDGCLSKEKI